MLHELKEIIRTAQISGENNLKTVFVSVVALEGSSYRKPGVRMSIQENDRRGEWWLYRKRNFATGTKCF